MFGVFNRYLATPKRIMRLIGSKILTKTKPTDSITSLLGQPAYGMFLLRLTNYCNGLVVHYILQWMFWPGRMFTLGKYWSDYLVASSYMYIRSKTWSINLLCNAIQYSVIQYNTIQYNTIKHSTIQFNTILTIHELL